MGQDGFDVSIGYGTFFFGSRGWEVDIKNYGKVIRDMEVETGKFLNVETGGAD